MVECGGLENRYPRKGIIGSNPILSAIFFSFVFFAAPLVRAEIIQLKNGNTLEAKVLKEDEKFVTVQIRGGKIKIPKNDIQMIDRGSTADPRTIQEK